MVIGNEQVYIRYYLYRLGRLKKPKKNHQARTLTWTAFRKRRRWKVYQLVVELDGSVRGVWRRPSDNDSADHIVRRWRVCHRWAGRRVVVWHVVRGASSRGSLRGIRHSAGRDQPGPPRNLLTRAGLPRRCLLRAHPDLGHPSRPVLIPVLARPGDRSTESLVINSWILIFLAFFIVWKRWFLL